MRKCICKVCVVLIAIFLFSLWFLWQRTHYRIYDYFPLNNNDIYTYVHHQDAQSRLVTMKVQNVKDIKEGRQFEFLWEGEYNDRVQVNLLKRSGLEFIENKHLVGEVPLKVIRRHEPALVMLPALLIKHFTQFPAQSVYDYSGNLINKDIIEVHVAFLGKETVTVEAGDFECLNFFATHLYKESSGRFYQMHLYNFWIAKGVGLVKQIHTFVPFVYIKYFKDENRNINNRYTGVFSERFELKKAVINGVVIGS